ncbi:MAG: pyrroline-5-carboxylate reductase [Geminicoccaceae bacterium]
MLDGTLLLVGCGKMGGALARGWLAAGLDPDRLHIIEPDVESVADLIAGGAHHHNQITDLQERLAPRVILFAVKPQAMADVLPAFAPLVENGTLVMSIAAGTPIARFEDAFGLCAVIRVMPNTPAAIGRGMSVLCANGAANADDRALGERLMAAVGEVAFIDDEDLMHAVTAVSGSGPAYVFWLAECLARAGTEAGLEPDLAARLANVTVTGAGALIEAASLPPETLRRNVTSPGGTTEAALAVLTAEPGLAPLMVAAVAAAEKRSRDLA